MAADPSHETSAQAHVEGGHDEGHGHPGTKTYLLIALVLTVITAAEVAVFYIPALEGALVPILLVMSAGKFALVVMFYMHLKLDSRIFSAVFFVPMALAIALIVSLIVLFRVLPQFGVS